MLICPGKLAVLVVHAAMALYWNGANMISARAFPVARDLWAVFGIYWIVSAARLRSVKQKEPWHEQLWHMVPMAVAFALIFRPDTSFGWFGARFVPVSAWKDVFGLWLTAAGIAFAVWARWHLGMNWSGVVMIRSDHELIETGPYRTVRHPIYTGMLVALLGTALVIGEVRGLIGVAIAMVTFYVKARKEETWLSREFGQRFDSRAKLRGMFLPKLGAS